MCFFWVWTIINHYGVFFVECYSVPHISGVSDLENGWPRSTHSWQVNRSQSALVRGPAWWKNGSFSWLETGLIKQWENAWLALWRLTTQGFKGNVDGELEHSLHDGIRRVRTYDVKVLEQEVAPYAKLFMQETDKIYRKKPFRSTAQLTDFVFILPRGELQKTRRKLAHMQSVAQRLRDQAAWFQSKAPNLSLPGQLQSMPLGALAGYT